MKNADNLTRYDGIVELFKVDIGVSHKKRDSYFMRKIITSDKTLKEKGIHLNLEEVEDQMLLSDFASWEYRNRIEGTSMPLNLKQRIRNKKMIERLRRINEING